MDNAVREVCKSGQQDQRTVASQRDVAVMARMVCEAARQAALDAISSVLLVAADDTPQCGERIRDVANQFLSRAALLQSELDRYIATARNRRR